MTTSGTATLAVTHGDYPELRPLHPLIVGDRVYFHGASAGMKSEWIGERATLSTYNVIAEIPSYAYDAQRACPATTFYESAQMKGVLRLVTDLEVKTEVLRELMVKYQAQGGYEPIQLADKRYTSAIKKVAIYELKVESMACKIKVGQPRAKQSGDVINVLWNEGKPGFERAIDLIASSFPEYAPSWTRPIEGLHVLLNTKARIDEVYALLKDQYWISPRGAKAVKVSLKETRAAVALTDSEGKLVAYGRATSDRARMACIYDVIVAPGWRGRGVGRALMTVLLDHPDVRECEKVWLQTRDADAFYAGLGFETIQKRGPIITMLRHQKPSVLTEST